MAQIPQRFPMQTEPAIASYDWTDIADGTGFVVFYIGEQANSPHLLIDRVFKEVYPFWRVEFYGSPGPSDEEMYNQDFELEFNLPRIIKGKAFVEIPHGFFTMDDGTRTGTFKDTIQIKKGSDVIASGNGTVSVECAGTGNTGTTDIGFNMNTFVVDIPETIIGSGDKLTINIKTEVSGHSGRYFIALSPTNTLDTGLSSWNFKDAPGAITQCKISIPFKINL